MATGKEFCGVFFYVKEKIVGICLDWLVGVNLRFFRKPKMRKWKICRHRNSRLTNGNILG